MKKILFLLGVIALFSFSGVVGWKTLHGKYEFTQGLMVDSLKTTGTSPVMRGTVNAVVCDTDGKLGFMPSGTTSSGTYTPTLTGNSGITLTNAYLCYWTRVGNIVTVTGQVDIQCADAAGTTESLLMSIPVLPSGNFSNRYKLNGVMNSEAYYTAGVIYASASQQLAWLSFASPGTLLKDWHFTLTYQVF